MPNQHRRKEFSADLIILDMQDFDVILGMDWLQKYKANIDCDKKQITLKLSDHPDVVYSGDKQGLGTTNIAEISVKEKDIKEIPVVNEFQDVFPNELPGLPPEREVEFPIELVPGTRPIYKSPYRMAPAELKELKAQLEDLEKKGFIRPSVSLLGSSSPVYRKER